MSDEKKAGRAAMVQFGGMRASEAINRVLELKYKRVPGGVSKTDRATADRDLRRAQGDLSEMATTLLREAGYTNNGFNKSKRKPGAS